MESQAVTRRLNTIAAHFAFAVNEDVSPAATHLLPMNCSCSLNSVVRRCDNRMFFARQASDSQACFMREVSTEQGSYPHISAPSKCTGYSYQGSCSDFNSPLFSRISRMESNVPGVGAMQPMVPDCNSLVPAPDSPKFARPSKGINKPKQPAPDHPTFARPSRGVNEQKQYCSSNKISAFKNNEVKWSPRMDIAESRGKFVITVELPGIAINNIRVVVDNQKLTVMGNPSTQWWKMTASPDDSISVYHQNEILQGACQIVWPLPTNVNRDSVSAEFVDGILQISIPKL